jgi:pyruvyl transferase EpsO
MAQRDWLRDHGVRCAYAAPYGRVDAALARRAIGPQGRVLLSGGGHLTDRWPDMLAGVRDAIEAFHGVPVIVLPQSVHFSNPSQGAGLAAAATDHGAVTMLVRDRASIGRAADAGLGPVQLCPDLAFARAGVERRARLVRPDGAPLVLRRGDCEAVAQGREGAVARGNDVDWISPRSGWRAVGWAGARTTWRALAGVTPAGAGHASVGGRLLDAQARLAVARGVAVIGSAGLVVTDRLHAALLGYLLGRDVVAVDSVTGKVHDVLRTWLADDDRVQLVPTWGEASARFGRALR